MTLSEVYAAVEGRLNTGWKDLSGELKTAVQWPNVPFSQPENGPWIRLTILPGNAHAALGVGGAGRRWGVMIVQVFVPLDSGSRTALGYAQDIHDLFDRKKFGGVTCSVPQVKDIGVDHEAFYQVNVNIPFWYFF